MDNTTATIMVVDDKKDNVHLLESLLVKEGYRVLAFLCPNKALKSLQIELPDLILLDINMPEMDGYEFASKTKHLPGGNDVPIIFVSAYQDVGIKTKAFAHGGVDYVTKPFKAPELLARIAVHTNFRQLQKMQMQQNLKLQQANRQLADANQQLEKLNNELADANVELEVLSETKTRFLSTMSHEIRTPISGAMGMIELLMDTPLDVTQSHYAKVIQNCGESLLNLLNDILDYSKIQAGKLAVEHIDFDLIPLIDDCCELFTGKSVSSGVELLVDASAVSFMRINGDPNRLRQILINLLSNAFKFTQKGSVSLTVTTQLNTQSGERELCFTIEDSGIGVTEETRELLFSPFFQAENSTSRRFGGTGLGLTICKQLLDIMGGQIGIESKPEQGSCFWFTVPLHMADNQPASDYTQALRGKHMLLIHDNENYRQQILRQAGAWGMKVAVQDNRDQLPDGWCDNDVLLIAVSANTSADEILKQVGSLLPDSAAKTKSGELPVCIIITEGHVYIEPEALAKVGVKAVLEQPFAVGMLYELLSESIGEATPEISSMTQNHFRQYPDAKVLVAEDNDVNQMVIRGILAKYAITPICAVNGLEALDCFKRAQAEGNAFDLILMDCEMPGMDGFQASQRIRAWENDNSVEKTVPIAALSAHVLEEQRQQANMCGINAYLTKPIHLPRLADVLETYLGVMQ